MKNNAQLIIKTNKNGVNVEDDYVMMEGNSNGILNNSFMNAKKNADNKKKKNKNKNEKITIKKKHNHNRNFF